MPQIKQAKHKIIGKFEDNVVNKVEFLTYHTWKWVTNLPLKINIDHISFNKISKYSIVGIIPALFLIGFIIKILAF